MRLFSLLWSSSFLGRSRSLRGRQVQVRSSITFSFGLPENRSERSLCQRASELADSGCRKESLADIRETCPKRSPFRLVWLDLVITLAYRRNSICSSIRVSKHRCQQVPRGLVPLAFTGRHRTGHKHTSNPSPPFGN